MVHASLALEPCVLYTACAGLRTWAWGSLASRGRSLGSSQFTQSQGSQLQGQGARVSVKAVRPET
jgi:hypothetical protein